MTLATPPPCLQGRHEVCIFFFIFFNSTHARYTVSRQILNAQDPGHKCTYVHYAAGPAYYVLHPQKGITIGVFLTYQAFKNRRQILLSDLRFDTYE